MLSTPFVLRLSLFSLSLFLPFSPFTHSRAVRALPAVPLICRFVCAFKHESPRRGTEQREATNEKRRSEERTPRQGGNKTGKRGAEVEREKGGKQWRREAERKRRRFRNKRGEKWLECPGKISSKRTKGKVRLSSLRTSPPSLPISLPETRDFSLRLLFLFVLRLYRTSSLEPRDSLSQLRTELPVPSNPLPR